jgi:hypothetical protein
VYSVVALATEGTVGIEYRSDTFFAKVLLPLAAPPLK